MWNLTYHVMNSTYTNAGGYPASDMYHFVHNTVLPNLKRSGLNITACDLVSQSVYLDILSKTGMHNTSITGSDYFWLTDTYETDKFCYTYYGGSNHSYGDYIFATSNYGVRPLITVVK